MLSTSARPLSTTFGGTCCSPSALRSRLSTTTSLVNEVTITATKGASASTITVSSADEGENWVRSMTRVCAAVACRVRASGSARSSDSRRQRPAVAPGHQPAACARRRGGARRRERHSTAVAPTWSSVSPSHQPPRRSAASACTTPSRTSQGMPQVGLRRFGRVRGGGQQARRRRLREIDRHAAAGMRRLVGRAQPALPWRRQGFGQQHGAARLELLQLLDRKPEAAIRPARQAPRAIAGCRRAARAAAAGRAAAPTGSSMRPFKASPSASAPSHACRPERRRGPVSIQRQSKSMPVQSCSAHSRAVAALQRDRGVGGVAHAGIDAEHHGAGRRRGHEEGGVGRCCTVALGRHGRSEYVADAHVSAPAKTASGRSKLDRESRDADAF